MDKQQQREKLQKEISAQEISVLEESEKILAEFEEKLQNMQADMENRQSALVKAQSEIRQLEDQLREDNGSNEFVATATISSEVEHAIDVEEGEKLLLLEKTNKQFWNMKKYSKEESGLVPAKYLKKLETYARIQEFSRDTNLTCYVDKTPPPSPPVFANAISLNWNNIQELQEKFE